MVCTFCFPVCSSVLTFCIGNLNWQGIPSRSLECPPLELEQERKENVIDMFVAHSWSFSGCLGSRSQLMSTYPVFFYDRNRNPEFSKTQGIISQYLCYRHWIWKPQRCISPLKLVGVVWGVFLLEHGSLGLLVACSELYSLATGWMTCSKWGKDRLFIHHGGDPLTNAKV